MIFKISLFISLLFLITNGYAQKQWSYTFDHVLEYEEHYYSNSYRESNSIAHKADSTKMISFLVNIKDDSFIASITPQDENTVSLFVIDRSNTILGHGVYLKNDLSKASSLTLSCNCVRSYKPPAFHENAYSIHKSDTILDNTHYSKYIVSLASARKEKRKKLGKEVYVIDENYPFKAIKHPETKYAQFKNQTLPDGLLKEKLRIDHTGKLITAEILKDFYPTKLKIILEKPCSKF